MIVIQHDLLLVDEEIASLIALVPFINTPSRKGVGSLDYHVAGPRREPGRGFRPRLPSKPGLHRFFVCILNPGVLLRWPRCRSLSSASAPRTRARRSASGSVTAVSWAQGADLPGQPPFVLAPTARALLAGIADDRVPVAVRFGLLSGGDLKRERFAVLELWAWMACLAFSCIDDKVAPDGNSVARFRGFPTNRCA